MEMRISSNLLLSDITYSRKALELGIDNTPDAKQMAEIVNFANYFWELLFDGFKLSKIIISSGFRCKKLNDAIKGANNSQHMALNGFALDIETPMDRNNKDLFDYIKNNLDFDQLIWEFGTDKNPAWIHVSYRKNGNRKQILRAVKTNNGTVYENYV
jgi:zinc D-Ala-D-Ala carboxypeptidase